MNNLEYVDRLYNVDLDVLKCRTCKELLFETDYALFKFCPMCGAERNVEEEQSINNISLNH